MKIKKVTFVKPVPLGKESVVVEHLLVGRVSVDGTVAAVDFDSDARFCRIVYKDKQYCDLVPLTNIASIHTDFDIPLDRAK